MAISRRKVPQYLSPLKSKVQAWLEQCGEQVARSGNTRRNAAWWLGYFALPVDEWTNPYASLENPVPWNAFVAELAEALAAARNDKQLWAQLVAEGRTPVDPARDPYALPEYFGWWQAENAFRRGYIAQLEGPQQTTLRDTLKNEITRRGNKVTAQAMTAVASSFENDPAIAHFFEQYGGELEAGTAKQFGKLTDLLTIVWDYRERAYQQFSPYFYPERAQHGGAGFLGIRGRRSRKRRQKRGRVWGQVGAVGAVLIRDFGRFGEAGDYLVQGTEQEAGRGDTYGIGDDYLDEAQTLLSRRGLELVPDYQGLVVQMRADR